MERAANSIRNIIFGIGGQILNLIMSFIYRTVLVRTLGDAYTGIAGSFTNILMIFSLADLGVGTAIIYNLYRPIAENDEIHIRKLMNLYRRAYNIIGTVILAMGFVVMFFLKSFIKETEHVENLYLIFAIYVINTASSYFLAYKGTLITANQKNYIVTSVVYVTSIICYIVQIVLIRLTRNYVVTISIQTATNMLQNVITMRIADRMYPFLKADTDEMPSKEERKKIYSDMRAIVFYRIGAVITNGTDDLIISSALGILIEGIYDNHQLLLTTVKNLLLQFFKGITASIGNLNVLETDEKKFEVYNMIYFANFWLFGFCAICFWTLFRPFITIWIGAERVLPQLTIFIVVLNFYITGMRNVNTTFRETMGIFKEGKYVAIIGAVINLACTILLVNLIGLNGVFLGTTVSTFGFLFWLEPLILHKYGFKRSSRHYFIKYAIYLACTLAAGFVTGLICDLIFPDPKFFALVGRILISMIVPNAVFFAIFGRTQEFRQLIALVSGVIKNKLFKKRGGVTVDGQDKQDSQDN
ncbi:MAG: lipopolysaccharide biosynthesis protein [Christensenellaceae bacterium]|nr:lipopolysaccharide biosynthesis protein [Christensenellaceae bacterium]